MIPHKMQLLRYNKPTESCLLLDTASVGEGNYDLKHCGEKNNTLDRSTEAAFTLPHSD